MILLILIHRNKIRFIFKHVVLHKQNILEYTCHIFNTLS